MITTKNKHNEEITIDLKKGECIELMKEIPDKSIDMILCDLPYGTTACEWDKVINFEDLWEQYHRIIKDNGAIVLFGSEPFSTKLRMSNLKNYRYDWIWKKNNASGFLNARRMPLKAHEVVSVFYKKLPLYNPQMTKGTRFTTRKKKNTPHPAYIGKEKHTNKDYEYDNKGTRFPISVLEFNKCQNGYHPTVKPVDLCEYFIKTYTNKGDVVLDNTMGSGTTGVACVNTGRSFIGIEMDENYFNIATTRITELINN